MNASTWQLAKRIFDEAREISLEDRQAFLDTKCERNSELRTEVEKLLGSYDSGFLEDTALGAVEALVKPSLADGQVIGRYRIGKMIGSGGMGQVFLGEDTELGRPVAFKVLHDDVGADDERLRRFVQEARAASALNHPNILTIHEIGSFEGFRFIVSEYVDGETLRERMRRGLSTEESIEITCQIAAALRAAHSAGIVHRDIKPENVMLRGDGLVKVLDFGLAKLTEADDQPIDPNAPASAVHTSPGLVMGTAAYMSPEQARGQAVDARTDLWSLGVVMHEMLTGASPFEGETVTQLIHSILKTDVSEASAEKIPVELRPICRKALTKDKDSRYRSAHDLLKDLEGEKKRMEYGAQSSRYISVSSGEELKTQLIRPRPTLSAEYIVTTVKKHKSATFAALAGAALIAAVFSVYRFNGALPGGTTDSVVPVVGLSTTEHDLRLSKLPTGGRVKAIAISPDGKSIAYVPETGGGKNSIRQLELATSAETSLVSTPSSGGLENLSFSPDGNYLYYLHNTANNEEIYRIPTVGGTPQKIADKTDGGGSLSPDGSTLAFQREGDDDSETLWLANPDGTNQRMIAKSPANWIDYFFCGVVPAWAPDGKSLACWVATRTGNSPPVKLYSFGTDGSRQPFSEKSWSGIGTAVFMPDGNLLIAALDKPANEMGESQLWLISPGREAKRITTDLNSYSLLSVSKTGELLVSLQSSVRRDLWVLPDNDIAKVRQVTTSGELGCGFSPLMNDRVVYCSGVTGSTQIWSMNLDGTGRKQLTRDGSNGHPRSSADGRFIVFNSKRGSEQFHVYRMNVDGTDPRQLTNGSGETGAEISPDGKWVYYRQWNEGKGANQICRVPIDGGQSSVVATNDEGIINHYDIANDGRIAYFRPRKVGNDWKKEAVITSHDGSKTLKTFILPERAGAARWTPDGRSITYADRSDGSGDVWAIPLRGKSTPRRLTGFRMPEIGNYHWTRDGKNLLFSRSVASRDAVLISRVGR